MPILACRCEKCGATFDYLSMGVADTPECPECRSREVARLLSSFAVGAAPRQESCACDPAKCPHPCPRALAGA